MKDLVEGKHTPGPWMWIERSEAAFLVSKAAFDKDPIHAQLEAIVDDGSAYGEYSATISPHSANALLIAAAPDLFDAVLLHIITLRSQVRDGKHRPEYFEALYQAEKKMYAALAKATGESQ